MIKGQSRGHLLEALRTFAPTNLKIKIYSTSYIREILAY